MTVDVLTSLRVHAAEVRLLAQVVLFADRDAALSSALGIH